jgi:hypothetical protein
VVELQSKIEGLNKELEGSKTQIGELEKKVASASSAPAPAAASVEAGADSAELVCSARMRGS